DSVYVLRDGRRAAHFEATPRHHEIVRAMVGDRYENSLAAAAAEGAEGMLGGVASSDEVVLRAERITDGRQLQQCSFSLRKGEILGVTGLLGSGQTELAEVIFGMQPDSSGEVWVDGRPVRLTSPRYAISAGVGLLP